MNDLVPLHFDRFDVRTVMIDGEPWWVGIDATDMLGIVKAHQALSRLEDYERGTYNVGTPSGDQEMIIINESGMYSLLLTSRKPIAKSFKRWLTTKVLPSIRKWGCYPPPPIALESPAAESGGRYSTPQTRFVSELNRIATVHDVPVTKIVSIHQLRAIELGASIHKFLTAKQRWIGLMGLGMDLSYVLHGIWDQTPHERRVKKQMREAAYDQRMLAQDRHENTLL